MNEIVTAKFDGPHKVVHCDPNGVTYSIRRFSDGKLIVKVQVFQLKHFFGSVEDVPMQKAPAVVPKSIPFLCMSPTVGRYWALIGQN